jgi:phosphoketolase
MTNGGVRAGKAGKFAPALLEPEVPLQVTVPTKVKRALDVKAAQTGRTRRALVLEGLKQVGVDVTEDDIAGRRGRKKT